MVSKLSNLSFENAKFNNRLAFLINFVSVIIFLYCGVHFVVNNLFQVNKIIIQGNIQHITPTQLSYVAKTKLHGTLFTLDIGGLKREFMEIPWIHQVSLKRHFPHTINVTIEEYTAIARVGDDSLVTDLGEVFDGADDDPYMPTFYVPADKVALALAKYRQINQLLAKHNDSLSKLWMNSPRVTTFTTNKNIKITICDENLTEKLALLDGYWTQLFAKFPQLNSLNLCYKNAVAISGVPLKAATDVIKNSNLKGKINK